MSCTASANCVLEQSLTPEDVDALLARYATPEYGYDIEDGFSICEALSRSIHRAADSAS